MKFITNLLKKMRGQSPEQPQAYGKVQGSAKPSHTLLPSSHKKQQIAALQSGYEEMLDLSRSIRDHLDSQQALQLKIGETLDQVPEAVGHLRQICRNADRQSEAISNLVESTCTTQEMLQKLVLRSERRMALLLSLFLLVVMTVIGGGFYLALPLLKQTAPATEQAPAEPETELPVAEEVLAEEAIETVIESAEAETMMPLEFEKIAEESAEEPETTDSH
jgi:hypothetical protein